MGASLELPPFAEPSSIASAIAHSLGFEQDSGSLPAWLREDQVPSVRRALAAVRRHGCALIADPPGTGKTYEALAVAARWPGRRPVLVFAPAAVIPQWKLLSETLRVPVATWTHQRVSRGVLPAFRPRIVIIDESHWYRNPATRRYRTLAPYLVGVPLLLLSATPIVNQLSDLANQLLLGLRDDQLDWYGVSSIASLLRDGAGHPALGQFVVCSSRRAGDRPSVRRRSAQPTAPTPEPDRTFAAIDRLALSTEPLIAGLVRGVLIRAACSSPGALQVALSRYRGLLLHAADASAAGRPMDRAALRRFTGPEAAQLTLWALLPDNGSKSDLALEDIEPVSALLQSPDVASPPFDGKAAYLEALVADGMMTLVFTAYRETVRYLRLRLAHLRPGWCTGDSAGIGHVPMQRDAVLSWFRPGAAVGPAASRGPWILLSTDVAAEGLDLQLAGRIVHYDLPWTPTRLDQREGRASRLGSKHAVVDVVRFDPPPETERRLSTLATIRRKATLHGRAGLGEEGRALFRWREELGMHQGATQGIRGTVALEHPDRGALVGFCLENEGTGHRAASVGWVSQDGVWNEAPEIVEQRLADAARSRAFRAATPAELARVNLSIAPIVADRVRSALGTQWAIDPSTPGARRLVGRLQLLIRLASRSRDQRRLAALEGALAFVAGGHTAGERALIERMAAANPGALERMLGRLPQAAPRMGPVGVSVIGVVVFGE